MGRHQVIGSQRITRVQMEIDNTQSFSDGAERSLERIVVLACDSLDCQSRLIQSIDEVELEIAAFLLGVVSRQPDFRTFWLPECRFHQLPEF